MEYRREPEESDRSHSYAEPGLGVAFGNNDAGSTVASDSQVSGASVIPFPGSPRRSDGEETRAQRSVQACFRCRKKKLRCTGGSPCTKCERAQEKCIFGKKSEHESHVRPVDSESVAAANRIAQLERAVADLLSEMSTVRGTGIATVGNAIAIAPPYTTDGATSLCGNLTDLSPPYLFGSAIQSSASSGSLTSHPSHPTTSAAIFPSKSFCPNGGSRTVHFGLSPTESQTRASDMRKNQQSPQSRLAVASLVGEGFSAPFQALTYNPALWENKEQSRRSSPRPDTHSRDESWPVFEARAGPRDDPITLDMLDVGQSETLFSFFFAKCHHFLPILPAYGVEENGFRDVRDRSRYLFSTIIAIGAKFYLSHCKRLGIPSTISPDTPAALARLSYSHLAASLFRKQHQLADVQATLLLSGWGLQSGGGGPDPWLVTGHCVRLGQRLGLNQLGGSPSSLEAAEKYLNKSRTWLGWYHFDGFLSLGFGRPQSQGFGSTTDQSFLQLCSSGLNGEQMRLDMYIASMVQLTQIGRDLISWIQLLTNLQTDISSAALVKVGNDCSIGSMLIELNKRLDEWTTRWTWNGSLSAIKLGKSGRLAKLQSEHVRLCLNSLALKPGLLAIDGSAQLSSLASYIQKATEAAINTIQAHADAVEEDMYLSYSVDYITIALGQAAVFLVRLHSTPSSIPIDRAVIAHYLRRAIEILEDTDLSETRNSTYVGRVCRDLSGVAAIDIPPRISEESPSYLQFWNDAGLPLIDGSSDVDLASFLQFDNTGLDLGLMFGLPMDALNARAFDERMA